MLPDECKSSEDCSSQTHCLCTEAAHIRQSLGHTAPAFGAQSPLQQYSYLHDKQSPNYTVLISSHALLCSYNTVFIPGAQRKLGWEGFLSLSIFLTFSVISASCNDTLSKVTSANGLQYWSTSIAPKDNRQDEKECSVQLIAF